MPGLHLDSAVEEALGQLGGGDVQPDYPNEDRVKQGRREGEAERTGER